MPPKANSSLSYISQRPYLVRQHDRDTQKPMTLPETQNPKKPCIGVPAQAGEITVPPKKSSSLFYISQRPYLVSGSLRDQLLYPHPPAAVWAAASPAERARFQHFPHAHLAPDALEERLCGALEAVELEYLLGRCGLNPRPETLDKQESCSTSRMRAWHPRRWRSAWAARYRRSSWTTCWAVAAKGF